MEDTTNTVFTSIEIHATAPEVWSVLTDWSNLQEWSSSFIGISTPGLVKGLTFTVFFRNPLTGQKMGFERLCTEYEEGKRFSWSGKFEPFGLTDRHIFSLETTPKGTTLFRQEDGFHGHYSKLATFLGKSQMESTYRRFDTELKTRVETRLARP